MALPQTVITHQMVLAELIKAGINRDIADDLAYRYYKNELTYKDLELIKLELKSDITSVKSAISSVSNEIALVRGESKSDFKDLNNKIDNIENNLHVKIGTVKNELDNKIDTNTMKLKSTLNLHNWMLGTVITLCVGILLTLIGTIYSLLYK